MGTSVRARERRWSELVVESRKATPGKGARCPSARIALSNLNPPCVADTILALR
jgi:hypothetical protein